MKNNTLNSTLALIILSFLVITSCKSPRDKDLSGIKKLETELSKETAKPDKAKLDNLLSLYIDFADKYPADSAAPLYLYRAINLSMGMAEGETAMKLIDRSINQFPKSKRYPEIVFLKAYVYENMLNEYGKAMTIYRDFAVRFPDHELADDAVAAVQNMGKTPEELVREFEAKAAQENNQQ